MGGTQKSKPAKTPRLHQALAQRLGTSILSGAIAPGSMLGGEIEQSEALRVSRTAYREAMRILIAKGLLESRPRTGTRVTLKSRWNLLDPDILAWMFSSQPDDTFICDLFELRGLIEPAAAAWAAQRRTGDQLAAMQDSLTRMQRFGLADEAGRDADQQFHRAVIEAADNDALASLASSVGAAVSWTTQFKQRDNPLPRDPLPDHVAVYDAIAAGDPAGAHRAMSELLRLALEDMQIQLGRTQARPRIKPLA